MLGSFCFFFLVICVFSRFLSSAGRPCFFCVTLTVPLASQAVVGKSARSLDDEILRFLLINGFKHTAAMFAMEALVASPAVSHGEVSVH